MLKTHRDVTKFGLTPNSFSVEAVDKSLAAPANAAISGERGTLSMTKLRKGLRGRRVRSRREESP